MTEAYPGGVGDSRPEWGPQPEGHPDIEDNDPIVVPIVSTGIIALAAELGKPIEPPESPGLVDEPVALSIAKAINLHQTTFLKKARCWDVEGRLVGLFFSIEHDDITRAKAYCAECPVAEQCLEGAKKRKEPTGIWGGHRFHNGSYDD